MTRFPPGAHGDGAVYGSRLRVLLAIVTLAEEKPSVLLGDLCERTGLSKATVHAHLERLRDDDGLISWDEGKVGTIRPSVARVPIRG